VAENLVAAPPPRRFPAQFAAADADRLLGFVVPFAVAAVGLQALAHVGNAVLLDHRITNLDADHDGNLLAWAGSAAIFAAACSAGVLAATRPRRRALLSLLAAAALFLSLDETASIHERLGQAGVNALALGDDDYGRLIWPFLLFPILVIVALGLWRVASTARPAPRRAIEVGFVLLAAAVVAELAWAAFPLSGGEIGSWPDALAVATEEGLELGGWLLVAGGLAAVALGDVLEVAGGRQ
jgi:hypothetical protein